MRLKDRIWGYPAMLPKPATRLRKYNRLQPRHEVCTVCVVSVAQNIRVHTPELVKTARSWTTRRGWIDGFMVSPEQTEMHVLSRV